MSAKRKLNVLVVDDSAVMRQLMTIVLSRSGEIDVVTASDPIIALGKISKQRPDVMVLDIEMPRMDGLTFLRKIMAEDPMPVVVCSGHVGQGTALALRAMDEGAVDVVAKPAVGIKEFLFESAVMLTDTIRAAAEAKVRGPLTGRRPQAAVAPSPFAEPKKRKRRVNLVAIGASTGGTEALRSVLTALPADAPPIVIVQHMPAPFTFMFAKRMNDDCVIDVREAKHGDSLIRGRALVAPGDQHVEVHRSTSGFSVQLNDGPLVARHRPSVDVLFRSVAKNVGPGTLGLIMTGMGSDGAEGLLEMRKAGAETVAQNEASCVVFGMPKEAITAGAVESIVGLRDIPTLLVERARR